VASTALLLAPRPGRGRRIGPALLGIVVWGGLLWSGGRAPALALAAGLFVWFVLRPDHRGALVRAVALQLVGGLLLSLALWTPRPELGWWHALRRTATAAEDASTSELTSTRSDFWRSTIHRAELRPWFGHGPDAYRYTTPKLDGQQPHNFLLQLWMDIGIAGAVPWLGLLAVAVWRAQRRVRSAAVAPRDDTGQRPPPDLAAVASAAWLGIAMASLACGLLDGVFYHLLAFLPAMLALGIGLDPGVDVAIEGARAAARFAATVIAAAVAILVLHSVVFYELALAPPPRPDAWPARLVRSFPSTTFGLWRWLNDWQRTAPDSVLPWTRWAERHSASQPFFHVYAAQVLQGRGDLNGARAELLRARATAHWSERPTIDGMLRQLPAGGNNRQ
ncbi:MAG TPA: O-antigen ligase family protein, partial [Opitutaceae bacterium]|nr:O-antigen ligase family protein [Opitutaceae bacterium]